MPRESFERRHRFYSCGPRNGRRVYVCIIRTHVVRVCIHRMLLYFLAGPKKCCCKCMSRDETSVSIRYAAIHHSYQLQPHSLRRAVKEKLIITEIRLDRTSLCIHASCIFLTRDCGKQFTVKGISIIRYINNALFSHRMLRPRALSLSCTCKLFRLFLPLLVDVFICNAGCARALSSRRKK